MKPGAKRSSTLTRLVAWCVSFTITLLTFARMGDRRPTSILWIGLSLVVSALIGAVVYPVVERLSSGHRRARRSIS